MSSENKKNSHLWRDLGATFIILNEFGDQTNPIDVNFHHQKSLEFFDSNSAKKSNSKITWR